MSCACGRRHASSVRLAKLGWRELGEGRFSLIVMCPCGELLEADSIRDASQCDACMRVITGTDGDVKVCIALRSDTYVLCGPCHRRKGKRPLYNRARPRWLS
jgi:hypothetical protein